MRPTSKKKGKEAATESFAGWQSGIPERSTAALGGSCQRPTRRKTAPQRQQRQPHEYEFTSVLGLLHLKKGIKTTESPAGGGGCFVTCMKKTSLHVVVLFRALTMNLTTTWIVLIHILHT